VFIYIDQGLASKNCWRSSAWFSRQRRVESMAISRLWLDEANQIRNNSKVKITAFSRMGVCIHAQREIFRLEPVARSARFAYEAMCVCG
jgi:hypothetical protein